MRLVVLLIGNLFAISALAGWDLQGNAEIESRLFFNTPAQDVQEHHDGSFSLSPQLSYAFEERSDVFTLSLHGRVDSADEERTHGDIRELNYLAVFDNYELRAGIGKVFWGTTEGQHLVDIVNQTDAIDQLDGEEKLGQPMVNLTVLAFPDAGVFDFFVLPGFRERTFVGKKGRLRPLLVINKDTASYEHSEEERHVDGAIRWSHSFDVFDIGLSHFYGTSRDPILMPRITQSFTPGPTINLGLGPHYALINQTGLDMQASLDGWLLKLEVISREGNILPKYQRIDFNKINTIPDLLTALSEPGILSFEHQRYFASAVGFEYTINELTEGSLELGLIAEWHYDERQENASTTFQDDLLIGTRWAFNNAQSSEILFGAVQDLDYGSVSLSLEASTRIGNHLKFSLEGIDFVYVGENDNRAKLIENEGFIKLGLAYYF